MLWTIIIIFFLLWLVGLGYTYTLESTWHYDPDQSQGE
jgi:LPS O-antigen subunit length determinant protein (WzzB/FepE family)